MLAVKASSTLISTRSVLGLTKVPLRRIPFSKTIKSPTLFNVRFCSTIVPQTEIVQPKIKPAYLSLGTDLAKR